MNLKPVSKRLLVEPLPHKTRTDSGIHLPAIREAEQAHYRVLAVGNNCDPALQPGSHILVKPYSGAELESMRGGQRIIAHSDVVAVFEK